MSAGDTPECEYSIANHNGDQAEMSIDWKGKSILVRLNLGGPGGFGGTNCGGEIEDPDSTDPWVEFASVLPKTPLGKPFTVPLSLDHRRAEPYYDEETGALASMRERSLQLQGALHFSLEGIGIPHLA